MSEKVSSAPNSEGLGSAAPLSESRVERSEREVRSPEKLDPETLAIRARTPRVTRFRKEVIIGGSTLAALALIGLAWIALQPRVSGRIIAGSTMSQPDRKPSDEALAGLPKTYGDVPKLGPPLPGDLGRPILKAQQRQLAGDGIAPVVAPGVVEAQQQHAAELKAAMQSSLLVQGAHPAAGANLATAASVAAATFDPGQAGSGETSEPAAADRKSQFADKLDDRGDVNPHSLAAPASPYMLMAGSVIAASLVTGVNSDVPGMVVAQVTQSVFDSATGQIMLIPQGARLVGKYDSVVAYGQSRALVIWQRLVMPDGKSLRLDNMPATDPSGYAGLSDKVNFHTGRLLKGVAIATLLGVGTELSIAGESDLVQAIRESAQTSVSRAGDQITQRNLDIQPSIDIRPGAPVRLVVRQDLVLAPWKGAGAQ
ncbi:TrbI/VirB10 family protein [Novosphingobium lindaniclasticum]|uniref:TrbI/VirB10 family protein n=1 Tax=Novosphingobium lindaniclasticum TaxID=1329895 RepID=UPI0004068E0C|nr:TrbI/VirB10 family protein [Novosphingobium lindaniclasticum]